MKIAFIVQLIILAIEISQAIATAFATFGATTAEIPGFIAATRVICRQLIKKAVTHIQTVIKDLLRKAKGLLKKVESKLAKRAEQKAARKASSELVDELRRKGIKFIEDDLVRVARDGSGRIVFLERGNARAGLQHIVDRHAEDFARRGVPQDQIADYVFEAVTRGRVVGQQGRRAGRDIYEFVWNGETHRVAASVGSNGFVVGANPA